MSKDKIKTFPDLSKSSALHQEANAIGDEQFFLWKRNVSDRYKHLPTDSIKKILKETSFPYSVCFENWQNDYNISSGFRNANAFNAKEVYYLGNKKIDKRGMLGVHEYTDIKFISSIDDFLSLKSKYRIVGFDNIEGARPLSNYKWQPNSMMVFGTESIGLTPLMQSYCDDIVYIEQFGSVRSLNVATASGIAMNDFICKYKKAC